MHVEIYVQGHLDQNWQEWLEGLQIVHEANSISRLSGPLRDQSALYGILTKLSRLNIPLCSLESSETICTTDR